MNKSINKLTNTISIANIKPSAKFEISKNRINSPLASIKTPVSDLKTP